MESSIVTGSSTALAPINRVEIISSIVAESNISFCGL